MVVSRGIHRFSSLSRSSLAPGLSGGEVMKLAIVISNFLFALLDSVCMHQFKCLATVVSRSWDMSLKCPWNQFNKRFLVCPTY